VVILQGKRENTMHYILDGLGSWRNVYAPVVDIDALVAWLKSKIRRHPLLLGQLMGHFNALEGNRSCFADRRRTVCAQAQSVPRASKDEAQRVVKIISGDKAKTQTYCDIQNLGEQMERAYEKRNMKLVDELLGKIETMEKTLGPEYVALIDGLEQLDPEKDKLGAEIMFEFSALNRLCTR
jgi:hypothetical protein